LAILILAGAVSTTMAADSGKIAKVLPLYLDLKGRDAISPSLFDRDAYQAKLRENPSDVSAIRFDILWKSSGLKNPKLKLRVEMRGVAENGLPRRATVERNVTPHFFRHWTSLKLGGDEFKHFGSLVAWKATLWNGDELLAQQKSFLW
jgi:hypothetical protein